MDVFFHPNSFRPQLGSLLLLTVTVFPAGFTWDEFLILISLYFNTTPEVIGLSIAQLPHGLICMAFSHLFSQNCHLSFPKILPSLFPKFSHLFSQKFSHLFSQKFSHLSSQKSQAQLQDIPQNAC